MFCNSHEKAKEATMYSYNKHINGFAALLEDEEASKIASEEIINYFYHVDLLSYFLDHKMTIYLFMF